MAVRFRKSATADPKASRACTDMSNLVQKKAYELYEKRGCSHGNDWSDWFAAERIVKRELARR